MKDEDDSLKELAQILLKEQKERNFGARYEKLRRILLLLASGAGLAMVLAMPGTARLLKGFATDNSDWKEWKKFNATYLRRTLKKLEGHKIIEIEEKGGRAIVKLTENGRKKVLEANIDQMQINKPASWDGKWRLIAYDILDGKKRTRDRFRQILNQLNFYPFQESLYLYPYPCGREVELLRSYLGISGEVRLIVAQKIENDQLFRDYFGV